MSAFKISMENYFNTELKAGSVNNAGHTPLSLASAGGHLNTVKYLVEAHHCDPKRELTYMNSRANLLF